jgi:hypothetical protein
VHNEELHNLFPSPSIIKMIKSRRMRWAGHVARMGIRGMYIGFWWEGQKERPLGRLKRRWANNIKMYFWEIVCGVMDWIDLAQDRDRWKALVNTVMNLRVP